MNEPELQHRKETIEKILEFNANGYDRTHLDERNSKTGKRYTNHELDVYLATLQAQAAIDAEDRLARAQAEREADRVLFFLGQQKAMEPQRQAQAAKQLAHDKEVFASV